MPRTPTCGKTPPKPQPAGQRTPGRCTLPADCGSWAVESRCDEQSEHSTVDGTTAATLRQSPPTSSEPPTAPTRSLAKPSTRTAQHSKPRNRSSSSQSPATAPSRNWPTDPSRPTSIAEDDVSETPGNESPSCRDATTTLNSRSDRCRHAGRSCLDETDGSSWVVLVWKHASTHQRRLVFEGVFNV